MFKYDNKAKTQCGKNIIEFLKQSRGIVINTQAAERINYLLNMRHLLVDSIEVSGEEINSGRPLNILINIKEINENIKNTGVVRQS